MSQRAERHVKIVELRDIALSIGGDNLFTVPGVVLVNFLDKRIDDEVQIQQIREDLLSEIENGRNKFLFNFSKVDYLGEVGVGMLVTLNKKVANANGRIVMYGFCSDIIEKLTIVKLDRHLSIVPSEEAALLKMLVPIPPKVFNKECLACARHLGVDPSNIMTVKHVVNPDTPRGLEVNVFIPTGFDITAWVEKRLEK